MRRIPMTVSILLLTFHPSHGFASIIAGPITNPSNGHEYYLLSQGRWTDAEAEANSLGGHLATIGSGEENEWVFQTFGDYGGVSRNLWIGLHWDASQTFVWVSGEPVVFTNWPPGEPNYLPGEEFVYIMSPEIFSSAKWNNYYDSLSAGYTTIFHVYPLFPNHGVVEVVPEPTSAVILAFGFLVVIRKRH